MARAQWGLSPCNPLRFSHGGQSPCALGFRRMLRQPFSFYNTSAYTDSNGDTQLSILARSSRGINPTDGNFGCRESAIFNIDLHAQAQWTLKGHDMTLNVLCYNIYDFGNVLTEYCFPQGVRGEEQRGPNMTLTIPRGILATLKVAL